MASNSRDLDAVRAGRSELENHYIDELLAGRIRPPPVRPPRRGDRHVIDADGRDPVRLRRRQQQLELVSSSGAAPAAGTPKKGGTLKVATQAPSAAVNPLTVSDSGGLAMLNQTGEFLAFDNNLKLMLEPMLALSWTPNSDGSVWTFKLRPGVTFHNGQAMTADDVVYTFQQLSNPKNASNALSAFTGVLTPSGVQKVDSMTVAFHLAAPNGNFPYLVSSDNYNAIIVPKGTDFSKWQSTFVGTGAFKLKSYTQNVGAEFVANPSHWGGGPYLDGTSFTFYTSQPPQILALQGGQVDVDHPVRRAGGPGPAQQPQLHDHHAEVLQPPRAVDAQRSGAVHRCARAPGRRPDAGPPGDGEGAAGREGPARQRQPVRADVPLDRHVGPPAHPEHRDGQAAAVGRRTPERLQHPARHRELPGDPAARAGDEGQPGQGGDQHQPQGRDPDPVLRQGDVRQLGLARRHDEPRRLRQPRRAERVPRRAR